MSILKELQRLAGLTYTNDDGEPRQLKLKPPLAEQEWKVLRGQLPCPIPADVEEALGFSRGLDNAEHVSEGVDLSGLSISGQYLEEFAPHALAIADDGCGNSWSLDLQPHSKGWGPVFFFCHDPPVLIYQFASVLEFLQQLERTPQQSELGQACHNWRHRIWRDNPLVADHAWALGADAEMAIWAKELGPGWEFVDLRQPKPGDGVSWGRYGPDTELRRHPAVCIVAIRKPEKKPWFFSRWFAAGEKVPLTPAQNSQVRSQ